MFISRIKTRINNRHTLNNMLQNASNLLIRKNPKCKELFQDDSWVFQSTKSGMEGPHQVYYHPDINSVAELIKDKLYFAILNSSKKELKNTGDILFFNTDNELVYNNFYNDFGPLNIACLYRYCCKVNKKLKNPANENKYIVHYTTENDQKKANAAYLITAYAVLYLNKSPIDAYKMIITKSDKDLKPFQDASMGPAVYTINLLDCLNALHKAASFGFFDFDDFDLVEYEEYEQMKNGDLNWMVPQKFLAFVGPSTELGTVYNPPECYIDYFIKNGVIAVVRLCKKNYDASRFTDAGIPHYEMFMPDGTVPPRKVLNQFLNLAENTSGPIAVHCKAGLGRTGSLIAAYLIKHYRMSAKEAIAWIRICRPGSVIGHQQTWLENMENNLLNAGEQYRQKYHGDNNMILHHRKGIYSVSSKLEKRMHYSSETEYHEPKQRSSNSSESKLLDVTYNQKINNTKFNRILGKLKHVTGTSDAYSQERTLKQKSTKESLGFNNRGTNRVMTQGDRLNEIKIKRNQLLTSSAVFSHNDIPKTRESPKGSAKRK